MRRLLIALAVVLLVVASAPVAAIAGDDDGSGGSSSGSGEDSGDTSDDSDARAEDDDSGDEPDDSDARAEDDDEDGDDGHQRRRRRRHRNRGGDGDERGRGGGTTSPPTGPAPATATVEVLDAAFSPADIRVAVGGTVTWSNVSREHTVTAGDGSFDSGVFDAGQRFDNTFDAPGTVAYRCLIHPDMTGTVTVGDGSGRSARGASQGSSPAPAATRGAPTGSSATVAGNTPASSAGRPGSSGLPALADGAVPVPLTAAAAGSSADVDVLDFEFSPSDVTVDVGATVRWTLKGQAPHTVTSDSFDSGMLSAGDVYEQTFTDAGQVAYRCDFHPEMTGTITVAAAGAAPPSGGGEPGSADTAGNDGGSGGSAAGSAQPTGSGLLADTGFRGLPALLTGMAVILLGWAALVTGRRRGSQVRQAP